MKTLKEYIEEARVKGSALGHFNISDIVTLKAILAVAKELGAPVMIGTSEGEREFVGIREAVALVRVAREEGIPAFLNADHTHSFEKIQAAVEAGYDEVLFDGSKLSYDENVEATKRIVEYVRRVRPEVLVEGEIGYIGSSSEIRSGIPEGAAVNSEDLTKPEEAKAFIEATGVDLLAPAVGNLHGMFANAPEPRLDISRIQAIAAATGVPLVLHGGSGNTDEDFRDAIKAGVRIVHINTELRLAWRKGLEEALRAKPEELSPYKILPGSMDAVKEVVKRRMEIFMNP